MKFRFLYLPFLIGIISALKINLIGELYIGEIIALCYVVFQIARLRLSRMEKIVVVFATLWATFQLVSDVHNRTAVFDAAKGVFAPVVFILTFVFILNYTRDKLVRLPSLLLGITLGSLIQLLLFPTPYFSHNFWKWGFGAAVLGLYLIHFSFFQKKKGKLPLFIFLACFLVISLNFDARSLAIFPLLAAALYKLLQGNRGARFANRFAGKWVGVKILFIALPILFVINAGASALFSSEAILSRLSSEAASKYRVQATGAYGVLLGGRSEFLISGQAFLDKPLLGHGSWAKDRAGYLDRYSVLRRQLGYSLREDDGYEDFASEVLIPAHSYLMGALVWAGVFGGMFWLVALNASLRIFLENIRILPLYFYVGMIDFIWNVFFSPFGASSRWSTAIFLAALFSYASFLKINKRVVV